MYFPLLLSILCAGIICGQQNSGTDAQEPRMHLYCTNHDDRPIHSDQRLRQVIAGKAGPIGPPGKVDYTAVNGTIKKYVKEISGRRLAKIRLAVDGNREGIQTLEGVYDQTQRQVTQLRPAVEKCSEDIEALKAEISERELPRIRLAVDGNREEIQNLESVSDQTQRQVAKLSPAVEKCSEDIEAFKAELKKLQKKVDLMEATDTTTSKPAATRRIVTTSETTTPGTNADTLRYEGKLYIALVSEKVGKATAESKCRSKGGNLANLYNTAHMNKIMNFVRQNKLDGESYKSFHLGMTYDPMNKILRLRDGTQVSISDYKWWPGYPDNGASRASYTNMVIVIDSDPSDSTQYLYNYTDYNRYVLCEI